MTFSPRVSPEFIARMTGEIQEQIGSQITGPVTATTLAAIRLEVERGIQEGIPVLELSRRIQDSTAFSEYRAEMIARTETARVYNATALKTYSDLGATEVQALDGDKDEECAARDGRTFSILDANGIQDHPNGTLDWIPIVPKTGGTLRPTPRPPTPRVPRTPQNPFGPKRVTRVRETPPVRTIPTEPPPVASTFEEHFANLGKGESFYGASIDQRYAAQDFWRTAKLDREQIGRLAAATEDFAKFQDFSRLRWEIESYLDADQVAAWRASLEFRKQVIEAAERFRTATGDRVFGSRFLRKFQFGEQLGQGLGYSRMGGTTLADADITGLIRLPPKRLLPYTGDAARDLRIATRGRGVDEIVTHELGHALHNTWRYGGTPADWAEQGLWSKARRASSPWRAGGEVDTYLKNQIGERDAWARLVKDWDSIPETVEVYGRGTSYERTYRRKIVELVDDLGRTHIVGTTDKAAAEQSLKIYQRTVTKLEKQLATPHMVPTQYASKSMWEDFAETGAMFLINPERLLAISPKRYHYMERWFRNV